MAENKENAKCAKCGKDLGVPASDNWTMHCGGCISVEELMAAATKSKRKKK